MPDEDQALATARREAQVQFEAAERALQAIDSAISQNNLSGLLDGARLILANRRTAGSADAISPQTDPVRQQVEAAKNKAREVQRIAQEVEDARKKAQKKRDAADKANKNAAKTSDATTADREAGNARQAAGDIEPIRNTIVNRLPDVVAAARDAQNALIEAQRLAGLAQQAAEQERIRAEGEALSQALDTARDQASGHLRAANTALNGAIDAIAHANIAGWESIANPIISGHAALLTRAAGHKNIVKKINDAHQQAQNVNSAITAARSARQDAERRRDAADQANRSAIQEHQARNLEATQQAAENARVAAVAAQGYGTTVRNGLSAADAAQQNADRLHKEALSEVQQIERNLQAALTAARTKVGGYSTAADTAYTSADNVINNNNANIAIWTHAANQMLGPATTIGSAAEIEQRVQGTTLLPAVQQKLGKAREEAGKIIPAISAATKARDDALDSKGEANNANITAAGTNDLGTVQQLIGTARTHAESTQNHANAVGKKLSEAAAKKQEAERISGEVVDSINSALNTAKQNSQAQFGTAEAALTALRDAMRIANADLTRGETIANCIIHGNPPTTTITTPATPPALPATITVIAADTILARAPGAVQVQNAVAALKLEAQKILDAKSAAETAQADAQTRRNYANTTNGTVQATNSLRTALVEAGNVTAASTDVQNARGTVRTNINNVKTARGDTINALTRAGAEVASAELALTNTQTLPPESAEPTCYTNLETSHKTVFHNLSRMNPPTLYEMTATDPSTTATITIYYDGHSRPIAKFAGDPNHPPLPDDAVGSCPSYVRTDWMDEVITAYNKAGHKPKARSRKDLGIPEYSVGQEFEADTARDELAQGLIRLNCNIEPISGSTDYFLRPKDVADADRILVTVVPPKHTFPRCKITKENEDVLQLIADVAGREGKRAGRATDDQAIWTDFETAGQTNPHYPLSDVPYEALCIYGAISRDEKHIRLSTTQPSPRLGLATDMRWVIDSATPPVIQMTYTLDEANDKVIIQALHTCEDDLKRSAAIAASAAEARTKAENRVTLNKVPFHPCNEAGIEKFLEDAEQHRRLCHPPSFIIVKYRGTNHGNHCPVTAICRADPPHTVAAMRVQLDPSNNAIEKSYFDIGLLDELGVSQYLPGGLREQIQNKQPYVPSGGGVSGGSPEQKKGWWPFGKKTQPGQQHDSDSSGPSQPFSQSRWQQAVVMGAGAAVTGAGAYAAYRREQEEKQLSTITGQQTPEEKRFKILKVTAISIGAVFTLGAIAALINPSIIGSLGKLFPNRNHR